MEPPGGHRSLVTEPTESKKGLSKLKQSPSVITDSFKFQQAEHKIEGHDQGK